MGQVRVGRCMVWERYGRAGRGGGAGIGEYLEKEVSPRRALDLPLPRTSESEEFFVPRMTPKWQTVAVLAGTAQRQGHSRYDVEQMPHG